MRQLLAIVASTLILCAWVFGWGVVATGNARQGGRYLGLWLAFIAALLVVGAVGLVIAWPFMPPA